MSALYWVAAVLLVVLVALIILSFEVTRLKDWLAHRSHHHAETIAAQSLSSSPETAEEGPAPALVVPKPTPKPTPSELTLKQKADEQTRLLLEKTTENKVSPAITPTPRPSPTPGHATVVETVPGLPPLVQPDNASMKGVPVRALPLDPNKLTTERIAAYQVALERIHFSCGFIDGDQGMRTQRMLRAFQASRGLDSTGILDQPTRDAIGEPGEPFLSYVVTQDDVGAIMPKPATWRAKSEVKRLGYNDIWELLAEKFHCTRAYLKALNRDVKQPVAGTEVIGPKVFPASSLPHAASLRILLSETSLEALDADGKIIAFFPCSIAKDKNKRPNGVLTVKSVVPNPDYTFDPALFADAAKAEGITKKLTLPPGPRNPVGTTWIGLSLPGYGIHGTPEPEKISATQSHGCFRLANWNAEKVLKMVRVGTPVDVQP
ncbi:MAG: L,D-transpeptidase [Methylacidiphilales bacterium]|nr:L,D-transpeptidase [Candidatus Methylacidiphilales bacterium]